MDLTGFVNGVALLVLLATGAYVVSLLVNSFRVAGFTAEAAAAQKRLLQERIADITAHREFERQRSELSWDGFRKFEIAQKIEEAKDIFSFYLKPHDKKPLPGFYPGQYLTFRLTLPSAGKPVVRCYSLSDAPRGEYYRISVKRQAPPKDPSKADKGKSSSNWLHDHTKEGDILDVKAPSGHFYLDTSDPRPVVLIGGGIGLTPVFSMLNTLVDRNDNREIWFFYGGRNSADHAMKEQMEEIGRNHPNVRYVCCYSEPLDQDREGKDYTHKGRVSADLFRELLPSNNYDFFFCGPPPMMTSLFEGLKAWGVPEERIHYEAFGPASVKPKGKAAEEEQKIAESKEVIRVTFSRSNKSLNWNPAVHALLDFAEENGIAIESGCRAGNCGSCEVAVKEGEVLYHHEPGFDVEKGSCLTCCSVPKTDLVIDA